MSKLDNEEKKIYNMFSQINVDSSNIAKQVKNQLHKKQTKVLAKSHKPWLRSTVAAIVLSMFLVVGATAAVLGNFEWFVNKFNPSFGSIIEPIEAYSEDQGIRMEVIGAQKYDNRAIVYLSLTDTTGQNRLTERTDFRDGFNVKTGEPNRKKIFGINDSISSGFSWGQKMIYFDEVTNTAYYEFNITTDLDTPLADPLELGSSLIYFDQKNYEEEKIIIPSKEIKDVDNISIDESEILGGANLPDGEWLYTKALAPGNYASMPHGEEDQWISNIGIIDGEFHVQVGKIFNKEFGPNDATIDLKDQDGNLIPSDYSIVLLADKDNNFLDLEKNDYGDAVYRYEEFIFPINLGDYTEYTLSYTGTVYSGIEGNWKISASLGDVAENILTITDNILIDGYVLEYITLSPLGLQILGTYEKENWNIYDMIVKVETVDGTIQLEGGGGSQNGEKGRFTANWNVDEPIEIAKVKSIIINDIRIPIK